MIVSRLRYPAICWSSPCKFQSSLDGLQLAFHLSSEWMLYDGLPVCGVFLFSFLLFKNTFLSWNGIFKVPEIKKKVPEKKVVVPKKEEAPPTKGTSPLMFLHPQARQRPSFLHPSSQNALSSICESSFCHHCVHCPCVCETEISKYL